MPSAGDIREQAPGPMNFGADGVSQARSWSVIAHDEYEAAQLLATRRGVKLGASLKMLSGQVLATCSCQSLSVEGRPAAPAGGLGQYIVTAEFSEAPAAPPQAKPGMAAVWTIRTGLESKPVDLDFSGAEILTSSLEPFDPPMTLLQVNEVLHGEFYVQAADNLEAHKKFRPYNGTLNLRRLPRLGVEPGCLFCEPFNFEPSDSGWIKGTVDFRYKPPYMVGGQKIPGWEEARRDKGTRKVVDPTNADPAKRFEWLKDKTGVRISSPVPFNGKGQPITTNFDQPYQGKGAVLRKKLYTYTDFLKIPFPKGSV